MKQIEKEIWKSVKDFSFYEVSNLGRVRSLRVHWRNPSILSGCINWRGYHDVQLSKQNKAFHFLVHRLVLEAFIGPCPDGHQANHKNGIKEDNRLKNLEWVTPSENYAHAYLNELINHKGTAGPNVKLCNEKVLEIRRLAKEGIKQRIIAEKFKIRQQSVSDIVHRRSWNHI